MITPTKEKNGTIFACGPLGYEREIVTYRGKSTDEKPTAGPKNADVFYEMDTGNVFMFDEDAAAWVQQ